MIKGVIIKKLTKYEDHRGHLMEIFRHDDVDYLPAMAYISVTKPGIVRGPHEHVYQSDYFVFPGPGNFEVHLWDRREESETKGEYMKIEAGENAPSVIIVPPGVVHGYKCIGDKDAYCINLADKLYKGIGRKDEVDEIRWEEREDSQFKIVN